MFSRILVPMDFSAPSDAALDYARSVAMRFDASLHLLHVADDPYRALYSGQVFVPEVERLRRQMVNDAAGRLKARLTEWDVTDFAATVDAIIGTPAGSIVEYAEGHGIDLIVMGSHGRSGMSHVLKGGITERVIRTAPCPVLTVREAPTPVAKAA